MSTTKTGVRVHDRPHRPIRWRRAQGGGGYFAEITEGGLVACTLVLVKRRLPFHRRSGIVVLERWTVSILEPNGRPRLDVPGGAFLSLASAKAAAVHELGRIGEASGRGRTFPIGARCADARCPRREEHDAHDPALAYAVRGARVQAAPFVATLRGKKSA